MTMSVQEVVGRSFALQAALSSAFCLLSSSISSSDLQIIYSSFIEKTRIVLPFAE